MGRISSFVDAIYKYESRFKEQYVLEEDQFLPAKEVIGDICQVLLDVSCMREEGRFPSFRVCFIKPDSDLLSTYVYAHALLFENPTEFNARNLHKLAPALNPDMSYLIVDVSTSPFQMIGIIAAYTAWEKILTKEITTGNRMPKIPNLFVNGPGELGACLGEAAVVNYSSGHCVFFRTDTFTDTLVAEQLEKDSKVPRKERLQLLYRIFWQMSNYGHGGAVLIVPSAESCREFIDFKYRMRSGYLFEDGENAERPLKKMREKEIVTYADLIAKLTSVDGSVILTKDFELLGFGAETLVDKMESKHPDMCFIGYDNREQTYKSFMDQGMRHRAGYRFCSAVEGSIAFIVSQDGTIEACTKHNGKVVVYDKVALPFI